MATSIDSYLTSYLSPYSLNAGSTSSLFNYGSVSSATKAQAQELLSTYQNSSATVKSLKSETAAFLDKYTLSIKTLDQSALAVRGSNLDKLLYDKSGNVTDETVAKTVKAFQSFVDNYNSNIKLLNDNADRGPGVTKQLSRMVQDPAPKESMKMVGVTVNKDGTLALDTAKMTEALKTDSPGNQKLFKDIIGGIGGIADTAHKNALYGANISARDLITNDLSSIQSAQAQNPFREMYDSFRGNAYYLNNLGVTGLMLNTLV